MDSLVLIALGGLALLAVLTIFALVVAMRGGRGQAEVSGRLAQMAESQAASQAALAERMQAQERAIGKALDDRLAELGRRVGESLEKTTSQTRETMTRLRERLATIDAAQKNITELSNQVVGLQDILSNKQARGAFGEIQLKDLVEAILPASAYAFQAPVGDGKRVDCLLKLPNPPGAIAIDAKFPLESYHALRNASSEAERVRAAREFGAAILGHVKDIKEKYIVPGETAEAALMFLPSEAVYAELHANFPAVVERSFRERVFIVSPTTLWATLNTVRAIFRDVRMREQTNAIQKMLHAMLDDVVRLDDRVGKLQRHFDQATRDVREIRTSTEKVVRRGERIDELQLEDPSESGESLAPAAPVRAALAKD